MTTEIGLVVGALVMAPIVLVGLGVLVGRGLKRAGAALVAVDLTEVVREALSTLSDGPRDEWQVYLARVSNEPPPGIGGAVDEAAIGRIRAAAAEAEGITRVGEPVIRNVVGLGWLAVVAVSLERDAGDELLLACAERVIRASPELAEVLICCEETRAEQDGR